MAGAVLYAAVTQSTAAAAALTADDLQMGSGPIVSMRCRTLTVTSFTRLYVLSSEYSRGLPRVLVQIASSTKSTSTQRATDMRVVFNL